MARHRSVNNGGNKKKPLGQLNQPNPKSTPDKHNSRIEVASRIEELTNLKSLLIDDAHPSELDSKAGPSAPQSSTAALHDELDSFRQRWKRELDSKNYDSNQPNQLSSISDTCEIGNAGTPNDDAKENKAGLAKEYYLPQSKPPDNPSDVYSLAKKLFLTGVELEQDEMHHESIRYYKQAMHLCPDIERQIFREQCEASLRSAGVNDTRKTLVDSQQEGGELEGDTEGDLPLYDRILASLTNIPETNQKQFSYCHPAQKLKPGSRHISQLPHDVLLHLFRYVIGQELDLVSLETLGLVCRGFYVLAHDPSLWRSICYRTWGSKILESQTQLARDKPGEINWRQLYIEKPRVNCDGVYISRTRYIRQGDVGFQDITYRPFHVIRYYRYIRFFPDKRVLILTTNEEPEKIIPIFRHALNAKHFAPELTVLEGSYEFFDSNHLVINADKDFTKERDKIQQQSTYNQRRQARFHWSRQTPISQKFYSRFELKTMETRPFRNNILKWLEYSINTELETGHEVTTFDLSPDTFPNLSFSRVKKFNLKLAEPLASH